jgi:hypothetical protein
MDIFTFDIGIAERRSNGFLGGQPSHVAQRNWRPGTMLTLALVRGSVCLAQYHPDVSTGEYGEKATHLRIRL